MADVGLHRLTEDPSTVSPSASGLVTTLVPSLVAFAVMVILFIILRRTHRRMYMPRTYIGYLRGWERTPDTPTGLVDWIKAMYKLPDTYVLQHHSMDAYLLLRFLKMCSVLLFVGCCMTFPVLWPVNATGGGGQTQLNLLSISNIGENSYAHYFAHCFISCIFVAFIFFMVTREHIFYVNLRQAYLLSPAYANRISSRTVLFTAVTPDLLSKERVRTMFGSDKVKNVWVAADTKELEEKVKERDSAAMKLEGAETKLIVTANKARNKVLKKQGSAELPDMKIGDSQFDDETGSVAARWVQAKDRPAHRLVGLIGKKVDTINWARAEIQRLTPEIEELQAKHRAGDVRLVSSIFVEFYHQADAQASYQSVAHNLPLHMSPRYIGLDPTQVIWANLRIKWWERLGRHAATIAFVCVLIIFWAIPTAAVGAISNINALIEKVHFLSFINSVPSWIKGVITGLLPVVLMSILISLVPIIFRRMAKWGGDPSAASVELTVQNWFFAFQVVQVFLVITLASAATSVVTSIINNPSSAVSLLASKIPLSANFYVSYIILQGLSFSSSALLQIVPLVLGKILGKFLDSTPRKMYTRWSNLAGIGWGTVYPGVTLLAVVGITYSCIAPLVMGFGTIGLYLFYFAYRYNLLYVSNANIDTQGRCYIRGLQHLTVGCYLLMICLIGLFAMVSGFNQIAIAPLILEIIFLVFVILYHISMNGAMEPLLNYLPKNLEVEEEAAPSTTPKANIFTKFLRPDRYNSYHEMRKLVPTTEIMPTYSAEAERDAYRHPSITAQPPLLWIPRDALGVSSQEVAHTMRVIPITDEDSWLDENCKISWNMDKGQPPIHEEKIAY
ncbi:uncharacterized protein N7446_010714 [Penicillium canescens]|uniref:DUF221-domain-containing protein n=1 Tax=Penicillium canescens TaxID=5083 RepID=A0AAD6N8D2_PENCN|nr:uncharacterized protein N7446_010714 [Penicillium canescens]KAJ6041398.1 hypothetical protein N7460_006788 [Penicillium canescens]KAJ6050605.1 hypothetical protein N7446_010714 [Penicillium canescens]